MTSPRPSTDLVSAGAKPSAVCEAPLVSVVIPAHNAAHTLGRQLQALTLQSEPPSFEVIVALNRCSDATASVVSLFGDKLSIRCIDANAKASAAYARNQGVGIARASTILFCDADDRVGPQWIAELSKPLLTGLADFTGGAAHVDRTGLPEWMYKAFYELVDRSPLYPFQAISYPISASLGCTRSAFDAIGGFDETFLGAGYEEVHFSLRLLRAGFRVQPAPLATYIYQPRRTLRAALRQQSNYARGGVMFQRLEGEATEPPLLRKWIPQLLRRTAGHVVRRRATGPRHLVGLLAPEVLRTYWHLRLSSLPNPNPKSADSGLADFLVPPDIPVLGGFALLARSDMASWYAKEGVEKDALLILERLLEPGQVFVDCGANIGVFAIAASKLVGTGGSVIAYEPDPRTRQTLSLNISRSADRQNILVRPHAVGARGSIVEFNMYENDTVSGLSTPPDIFEPGPLRGRIPVEVVALDSSVDGPVDFLKIDVEGHEEAVLAGASRILSTNLGVIVLMELNPASLRAAGHSCEDLLSCFPMPEWTMWLIDEDRTDSPILSGSIIGVRDAPVLEAAPSAWYASVLVARASRNEGVGRVVAEVLANKVGTVHIDLREQTPSSALTHVSADTLASHT